MVFEKEKTKENTRIGKIIAVMSGKGGVGKSSVAALTAVALRHKGYTVGVLDADITGPSVPKLFGVNDQRAFADSSGIQPVVTWSGIKIISLNLLIDKEEAPVVWRGPLIAGAVKQFYTDVAWGELDYLLIDLPPGTGDVPLTIMQSIPVNGIIIVSSPQDLVQLIVKKSVNMAKMMGIPVIGIVENMSHLECPYCNNKIHLFGKSNTEQAAGGMTIDVIAKLPVDSLLATLCDEGKVELYPKLRYHAGDEIVSSIEQKIGGMKS